MLEEQPKKLLNHSTVARDLRIPASRVLWTSQVVYQSINHRNLWSIAYIEKACYIVLLAKDLYHKANKEA